MLHAEKLIIILAAIGNCFFLPAQNPEFLRPVRSLRLYNDTAKCRQLLREAKSVRDSLYHYDLALELYQRADSVLPRNNYPYMHAQVYYEMGFTCFLKANFKAADNYYSKALSYHVLDEHPDFKAKILHNAGINLTRMKVFKRAMAYYDQSLALFIRLKNNTGIGSVYFNMSTLFSSLGKVKQAKQLMDKANSVLGQNTFTTEKAFVLMRRGYEHSRAENYDSAKLFLLRALKTPLATSLRFPQDHFPSFTSADSYMHIFPILAKCYAAKEKWDSCFYFLEKGKRFSDSLGLAYSFAGEYDDDMGYCYDLKGDYDKALHYYKTALRLKIGSTNCRYLLENIADIYFYNKQYDSAFVYKERAINYSDSLYTSELKEHIAFEENRIDLMEADYKDQVRSAQREKQLEQLSKRNYIFISLIVLLTAGVVVFLVYFRQYRLRVKKEHLQSELDFLRAQLNPHFLFNSLNNIYVLLNQDKEKALNILLKFSELMRYQLYECNVSAIELSKELNFLENYIHFEELRYSDKITVHCDIDHSGDTTFMIAPLLLLPFIENAFKHSPKKKDQPSRITIKIALSGPDLLVTVSNKRNSQTSALPGGIGLKNVKKRLRLLYPGRHDLHISKTEALFIINLKLNLAHD